MKKFLYTDNEKHRIYKNDFIEIGATGHVGDFCGYIVNRTDKEILLKYDDDYNFASIDPNGGVGLFCNDENYLTLSYLLGNNKRDMFKLKLFVKDHNFNEYAI